MKLITPVSIMVLLAFAFGLQIQGAQAKEEECCSQPGRIESAKHLLAQSENFKLKASQFHLNAKDSAGDAKKLKGQADKLRALTAAVDSNSPKEFKANIEAFKEHANQYRAHLDKVERELGHCQAGEKEYQAHLQEYTLHAETFHVPNIRPPHICGQLQVSEHQASHMANTLRADQTRLVNSETDLAKAENKLENAMQASIHADGTLYRRSQLAEAERKLAGEFAGLKTEYELLQTQQQALLGKLAPTSSKTVHGKVK